MESDPQGFVGKKFRFVFRDGEASWRHPIDKEAGDLDWTDQPTELVGELYMMARADMNTPSKMVRQ